MRERSVRAGPSRYTEEEGSGVMGGEEVEPPSTFPTCIRRHLLRAT